jgi:5-methylcytosine-specific restriction enzyme subunit McrC
MKIPIKNIYYMLCYAWDTLQEREIVQIAPTEDLTELVDFFARVLIGGLNYLRKRGMDRGYVPCSEDSSTIRGRIEIGSTVKRNLLVQVKAHCQFDVLSHNVLHNQIVKSTIERLIRVKGLDQERIKPNLVGILRWYSEVDSIPLSRNVFTRVQLHRNNSFYRLLLGVCQIIYENLLISEESGETRFRDFRDNQQSTFSPGGRHGSRTFGWDGYGLDEASTSHLPAMHADIVLGSDERTIIIDAKYYVHALATIYEKERVQSHNLYQIYSYVRNAEAYWELDHKPEGILLYPTAGTPLNLQYVISGHRISIRTIDLNQDWKRIHDDLLEIIGLPPYWRSPSALRLVESDLAML